MKVLSEEHRQKLSEAKLGEKNPRWNNGRSEYPDHCELKRNRKIIFRIKNYRCEYCNSPAQVAHHVNGNKGDHSLKNLLVLCTKCHGALHHDPKKRSKYILLYGKTLQEIADRAHLSTTVIWKFFNNNKKIRPENRCKISKALSKSLLDNEILSS